MTEFKRVFLDTSPVIYYLQQDLLYFERTKNIFITLSMSGAEFVLSDITIAEYCVFPFRNKNYRLVEELKGSILTNDRQLKQFKDLNCVMVEEWETIGETCRNVDARIRQQTRAIEMTKNYF